MPWRPGDCTGNDFLLDACRTEKLSNACISVSEKPVRLSVGCARQGVPGVREHRRAPVAGIRPRKCEPHDGLASVGSLRPSTLSCAACAHFESNHPSSTYRFLTVVPPMIGCATRLSRT
ncbi:hypothetical protein TNIN_424071 [Trichonephila inaurata madagascariensis]|uniref:Uncharacterized protein n=1 Tax=Trichonephila inaurata madagascariensis TaxID=2747483 RepID=A0A8X7BWK2_9ARAC|nr:hypothetical protein TNIN_424071 [Trichonephila inaurata madagascariensis]